MSLNFSNNGWIIICLFCFATISCTNLTKKTTAIPQQKVSQSNESAIEILVQPDSIELKKAAKLLEKRKVIEAIPILEKFIGLNPNDPTTTFALGVALIRRASTEKNLTARKQLVIEARKTLERAKRLGCDDYFLDHYMDLPADGVETERHAVDGLAAFWAMHPPKIFENDPPDGIKLLSGYRHKSSTDFEGGRSGVIWKPKGLKIQYEFANQFQGEGYTRIKSYDRKWEKEKKVNNHFFKYALSLTGELIITAYEGVYPIADFMCDTKSDEDIEEVLTMVTGLTGRRF